MNMDKKIECALEFQLPITLNWALRVDNAAGEKLDGTLSQPGRGTMKPCGPAWIVCKMKWWNRGFTQVFNMEYFIIGIVFSFYHS